MAGSVAIGRPIGSIAEIIIIFIMNTNALRCHRLGYRLGLLVGLIYGRGTHVPRGAP